MRTLWLFVLAILMAWSGAAFGAPSLDGLDLRFYAPAGVTAEDVPLGTRLVGVGVLTGIDAPFTGLPAPGPELEYTVYLSGLDAIAWETKGPEGDQTTWTAFAYGTIEIYQDPTPDHAFGVAPPNATVPATFTDGALVFQGSVEYLVLMTKDSATSVADGLDLKFQYGLNGVCISNAFGTLSWGPEESDSGFIFRHVGGIAMDCTDPATASSWGRVKAGYR
jgi:hypothetical protein